MDMFLKVRKRDGTVEDWSFDKALNSIAKSGFPVDKAENVTVILEAWMRNHTNKGTIDSVDIRDKIIALLTAQDPLAASAYQDYKKA